jgi:hypothetical protein
MTEWIFFQYSFLDEIMGVKGCGLYRRGCMKEQRLVGRSFMCVHLLRLAIRGKSKNYCLEMSVNNAGLLEKS